MLGDLVVLLWCIIPMHMLRLGLLFRLLHHPVFHIIVPGIRLG